MNPGAKIAVLGYSVALYLVTVPIADTLEGTRPFDIQSMDWRFGALGLSSRAIELPLLGLLLAFAVAIAYRHRITLKLLGGLGSVAALVLMGACGMLLLDAMSMRGAIRPEFRSSLEVAALLALSKYSLGILITMAFAWVGLTSKKARRN